MRGYHGKDFVTENIGDVWDFQDVQNEKREYMKLVRHKNLIRAGTAKKMLANAKSECVFYRVQKNDVRNELFRSLVAVIDRKNEIESIQKFWLVTIHLYH